MALTLKRNLTATENCFYLRKLERYLISKLKLNLTFMAKKVARFALSVGNIYRSRDYLDYCKKYNQTRYKKLTTSQRKRSQGSAEKIKILMHKYIQEYQERQRANSRCTLLTILLFFSLVIIVMLLAKGAF